MKKVTHYGIVWFLCLCAATAQAAKEMSVQVRNGQLRDRPSFLGAVKADVPYGDRVVVEAEQGPWRRVTTGDLSGWIHASALTRQRIKLAAGEEDVSGAANEQELALAGKGFNAKVESEFREQNQAIDFSWVNRMEKMGIETRALLDFLKAGDVHPASGGQP